MLGTMEANEILLQAFELPQHFFDIHITPREENAKGKKGGSASGETANQAKEGREARKEKRLRDGGIEQKSKTDLVFHCLVCHGTLAAPNPTPAILCDFSPLPSYSSQMHAFVLPSAQSRGRQWDSCTVGSL